MSDNEKELTTDEKAALIGKDIPDEEKDQKIPDYDVTEDDGSDEGQDERLGKTRDGVDHKQMSNREKRQLRKKRLAEKFDAKDTLIKQQADQLNALAARLNNVEGKFSQVDQAQLVQAWNENQSVLQGAEKEYSDAFSAGDGAKATSALTKMYEAKKRADELQAINAHNQSVAARPRETQNRPDPVVVNRAQQWAEDNPWFKHGGSDDDSAIADAIASKLVRDGYDPKSDDYWDELDDRLSQKGIGDREDDQEQQSQSQRERQMESKPAKRRSPPVGGGSGRGDLGSGKVAISLPTAFVNTLKSNGYWEDKSTRDRMIKRYFDGIKQREAEGK